MSPVRRCSLGLGLRLVALVCVGFSILCVFLEQSLRMAYETQFRAAWLDHGVQRSIFEGLSDSPDDSDWDRFAKRYVASAREWRSMRSATRGAYRDYRKAYGALKFGDDATFERYSSSYEKFLKSLRRWHRSQFIFALVVVVSWAGAMFTLMIAAVLSRRNFMGKVATSKEHLYAVVKSRETVLKKMRVPAFVVDDSLRILDVNAAALKSFGGYDLPDLRGKDIRLLLPTCHNDDKGSVSFRGKTATGCVSLRREEGGNNSSSTDAAREFICSSPTKECFGETKSGLRRPFAAEASRIDNIDGSKTFTIVAQDLADVYEYKDRIRAQKELVAHALHAVRERYFPALDLINELMSKLKAQDSVRTNDNWELVGQKYNIPLQNDDVHDKKIVTHQYSEPLPSSLRISPLATSRSLFGSIALMDDQSTAPSSPPTTQKLSPKHKSLLSPQLLGNSKQKNLLSPQLLGSTSPTQQQQQQQQMDHSASQQQQRQQRQQEEAVKAPSKFSPKKRQRQIVDISVAAGDKELGKALRLLGPKLDATASLLRDADAVIVAKCELEHIFSGTYSAQWHTATADLEDTMNLLLRQAACGAPCGVDFKAELPAELAKLEVTMLLDIFAFHHIASSLLVNARRRCQDVVASGCNGTEDKERCDVTLFFIQEADDMLHFGIADTGFPLSAELARHLESTDEDDNVPTEAWDLDDEILGLIRVRKFAEAIGARVWRETSDEARSATIRKKEAQSKRRCGASNSFDNFFELNNQAATTPPKPRTTTTTTPPKTTTMPRSSSKNDFLEQQRRRAGYNEVRFSMPGCIVRLDQRAASPCSDAWHPTFRCGDASPSSSTAAENQLLSPRRHRLGSKDKSDTILRPRREVEYRLAGTTYSFHVVEDSKVTRAGIIAKLQNLCRARDYAPWHYHEYDTVEHFLGQNDLRSVLADDTAVVLVDEILSKGEKRGCELIQFLRDTLFRGLIISASGDADYGVIHTQLGADIVWGKPFPSVVRIHDSLLRAFRDRQGTPSNSASKDGWGNNHNDDFDSGEHQNHLKDAAAASERFHTLMHSIYAAPGNQDQQQHYQRQTLTTTCSDANDLVTTHTSSEIVPELALPPVPAVNALSAMPARPPPQLARVDTGEILDLDPTRLPPGISFHMVDDSKIVRKGLTAKLKGIARTRHYEAFAFHEYETVEQFLDDPKLVDLLEDAVAVILVDEILSMRGGKKLGSELVRFLRDHHFKGIVVSASGDSDFALEHAKLGAKIIWGKPLPSAIRMHDSLVEAFQERQHALH